MDKKVFDELMNRGIITNVGLNAEDYNSIADLQKFGIATGIDASIEYNEIMDEIANSEESAEALTEFFNMIAAGGTVTLDKDIYITTSDMISVTKDVVLDLNGHSIKKTGLTDSGKCVLFYVKGANLTIKGEGDVKVESGKTDIAVWSDKGATVNIESGNFYGVGNVTGSDLIYAMNGKINVSGGTFKLANMDENSFAEPQYSLLNAYGAKVATAKNYINVTGGKFFKFNPANNVSEGVGTSFVADGYESVADGDWFVIKETEIVVDDETNS
jgi:hypothetical protein